MTTQFIKRPGAITIAPDFTGITIDRVPAGYYRIGCSQDLGFHLVPVDKLQVAGKIYGSLLKHLPRIEAAFNEQTDKPMTVMLEGLKGSGKSLLMKTLANRFVENEDGIVLLCNSQFVGDDYFEFLQKISQKKIVLMDEFDKVYNDKDARNNILTLLDGNYASHTMFILTMNANLANGNYEFFHNRPGRVMFSIKFRGVEEDAIRAYAEDHLNDVTKVPDVMTFVKRFTEFNMDMLSKLIAEINYCPDLSLEDIATYLNVKPDLSLDDIYFNAKFIRNGLDITKHVFGDTGDRALKRFLTSIDKPGESYQLNLMLRTDVIWNETKGMPYDSKRDKGEDTVLKNGVLVHVSRGKKEFLEGFDEYVYSSEVTRVQDPKTGEITLTAKSDDDSNWVIQLMPEVAKRYTYAF